MPSRKRAKSLNLSKSKKRFHKSKFRAKSLSLLKSKQKSRKFNQRLFTKRVNEVYKHCKGECKKAYAQAAVHTKPNLKDLDKLVFIARSLQAAAEEKHFLAPISPRGLLQLKRDKSQELRELINDSRRPRRTLR